METETQFLEFINRNIPNLGSKISKNNYRKFRMADMVDIAQDCIPNIQKEIDKIQSMFIGESNTECEECGEEIPERRRKLGNVKLCVDCANDLEKRLNKTKKIGGNFLNIVIDDE